MPSAPVVMVTSRSFSSGASDQRGRLVAAGYDVISADTTHNLDALMPVLARATAWIAGTAPVTDEHLALAPELKIVARYGVGVDAVDIAAASRRGITVANTPGANTDGVADHAVALMLAALRRVGQADRAVRSGQWSVVRGLELGHRTIGVVGAGRIGRAVATRLAGFGPRILAADPYIAETDLRAAGLEPASIDEIAHRCDLITLHSPGGDPIVTRSFLAQCNPDATIINTARAGLVDEQAVAAALRERRLAFYAADTLGSEGPHLSSPLLSDDLVDQTLFTPHIGAQTREAVDGMGEMAVDAVIDALAHRRPRHCVEPLGHES